MMDANTYDLIVVGGGPGGLSAAVYAGRANRKTLIIEKGSYGGRINDTIEIRNYAGTVSDSGRGLMEKFKAHAESYPSVSFVRTTVTGITKEQESFVVQTKRRGDFRTECVILDTGTKPRMLGIKGEVEFAGHGVAYCATCDAEFFKGKEIYVLGAGDQAVEESCYLTGFAEKVHIVVIHEEGHLDCNQAAAEEAYRNPKIDFIWNSTLGEIKGGDHVESIVLRDVVSGTEKEVSADGVFFFIGMVPQTELVKGMVTCDRSGYVLVNDKKETNIPGLYAVGDCTQTFLRQVVVAASDGAVAATASERYARELEQLRGILGSESGKIAFLFYNPYDSAQIGQVTQLEERLKPTHQVYRQDITRQNLLYRNLGLENTVSVAFFEKGKMLEKKTDISALLK